MHLGAVSDVVHVSNRNSNTCVMRSGANFMAIYLQDRLRKPEQPVSVDF